MDLGDFPMCILFQDSVMTLPPGLQTQTQPFYGVFSLTLFMILAPFFEKDEELEMPLGFLNSSRWDAKCQIMF